MAATPCSGDAIARVLAASGYAVQREYYFNDAGRQMRILGESTKARYLELLGLPNTFPEDGYQGDYIYDIARTMITDGGDSFKDAEVTSLQGQGPAGHFCRYRRHP